MINFTKDYIGKCTLCESNNIIVGYDFVKNSYIGRDIINSNYSLINDDVFSTDSVCSVDDLIKVKLKEHILKSLMVNSIKKTYESNKNILNNTIRRYYEINNQLSLIYNKRTYQFDKNCFDDDERKLIKGKRKVLKVIYRFFKKDYYEFLESYINEHISFTSSFIIIILNLQMDLSKIQKEISILKNLK